MDNLRSLTWPTWAAASLAAVILGGCHDDTVTVPASQAQSADVPFSVFATQAYSNSANSTPVQVNNVSFIFDVNDQPAYFTNLIAMGSY